MFSDRVKQLKSVSISDLINDLFKAHVSIEYISENADLRNIVLKIEDKYILKVFGDKKRWRKEIENLVRMKKSSFEVPTLIDYGMVNLHIGWILMNLLPGTKGEKYYSIIKSTERASFWYRLGSQLAYYHQCNIIESKDVCFLEENNNFSQISYYDYIYFQFAKNSQKIIQKNYYNAHEIYKTVFNKLNYWLNEFRVDFKYVLCHNDFDLRNVLYNFDTDSYVLLDFESCTPGQHEADFSQVLLNLIPQNLEGAFLNGYYDKNLAFTRNDRNIYMHLLLKIVEICSWSYERVYPYYENTFNVLKKIYNSL